VTHIALDRRFVVWNEEEGSAIERLRMPRADSEDIAWKELRTHQRIVMLAEAGSGKSEELKEQARALSEQGDFAFYTRVHDAALDGLSESLLPAERERLAAWIASDRLAWFFIDSVDEAKLDRIDLGRALRKVADGVGAGLRRAHVILSGRITDWEFRVDLGHFTQLLPVPPDPQKFEPPSPDVILGRALRGDYHQKGYQAVESAKPPLTVLMTPLDEPRVRIYAAAHGIGDSDPFIRAIDAADLWFLARRPLDLDWLVAYWKQHGRFGALSAMIGVSLRERLRETNRQHAQDDSIDPTRAVHALERVGAAMVFGRADKIAVEDPGLSFALIPGTFRLEDILPDWSTAARRQLLTRAVFDPATYGCVRLHNDNEATVRAFLTARWLLRQRNREGSARALMSRLFSQIYGYALIRPSLSQTCAWLSLWDVDVAREVIAREPQLLLFEGDPGSLPAGVRSAVVTRVIEAMARTGDRLGLVNEDALRRIATSDLAPTVRALWRAHKGESGCRALLLRLIALGAWSDCADIAVEALTGVFSDEVTLVLAGRALMTSTHTDGIRAYADRVRAHTKTLPAQVLWEALDQLSPRYFAVEDFLSIVEGMDKQARTVWPGIDHFGPRYAERLRSRIELEQLLSGLVAILSEADESDESDEDSDPEPGTGHFKLLASIASALMRCVAPAEVPAHVIDIALRIRAAYRHRTFDETSKVLIEQLTETPNRRREVFWYVARTWADHRLLNGRPLDSVWAMAILGWPKHLQLADLDWVLVDANAASVPREAQLALDAALDLWARHGRRDDILQRIRTAFAERNDLAEAVNRWLTPRQPSPEELATNIELAELQAKQAEEREQRDESWRSFVDELRKNPARLQHLAPPSHDRVDSTLYYLWQLLSYMDGRKSRYAIDDVRPLEAVLGHELTIGFRDALIKFWRQWQPTLESTRAPTQRNVVSLVDCMGICSVSVEAKVNSGWPADLTAQEARRAAEYSTLELNGFPAWTARLASAWPSAVGDVILGEVKAELDDASSSSHVGPLQDLETGPVEICQAVARGLLQELGMRGALPGRPLSQVLTVLCRSLPADERGFLAMVLERASKATDLGLKAIYLAAGFHRHAAKAMETLRIELEGLQLGERSLLMEELLPALAGDMFRGHGHELPELPLEVIEGLVAVAFAEIRVTDDLDHSDGVVFSPGPRDRAERARDGLFRKLTLVPGPATIAAMRRIGAIPGIPISPDTIERLCRERAAADSDGVPWPPAAAYGVEQYSENQPLSAADLQSLAVSRLEDIAHDLRHGDSNLGRVFKRLDDENEVQNWVASELRSRQGQAYSVEREPHVAAEKKPDIRLQARAVDASVPIEVKDTLSDWSLKELEHGLTGQLCGRYLRARNQRHGIYLIVHRQPRRWRRDGKMIKFETLVTHLQDLADSLAARGADTPMVRLCAIDVSDI
jgi:hypothetical protein